MKAKLSKKDIVPIITSILFIIWVIIWVLALLYDELNNFASHDSFSRITWISHP